MESPASNTVTESAADERPLPAMGADSAEQVAAESASVRRFFAGDNVSMMGGWT